MTWRKRICVSTLLLAVWLSSQSAFAQFGVGFGAWSRGGHNTGYGGWFGTSIPPYRNRPFKFSEINKQASGYLEGFLTVRAVCPASQPGVACPVLPIPPGNLILSAEPYGANQWISTRPDQRGHYRIALPPGGYNLSIHHPYLEISDKVLRQIIIEPGKTNWQNFQIDHALQ